MNGKESTTYKHSPTDKSFLFKLRAYITAVPPFTLPHRHRPRRPRPPRQAPSQYLTFVHDADTCFYPVLTRMNSGFCGVHLFAMSQVFNTSPCLPHNLLIVTRHQSRDESLQKAYRLTLFYLVRTEFLGQSASRCRLMPRCNPSHPHSITQTYFGHYGKLANKLYRFIRQLSAHIHFFPPALFALSLCRTVPRTGYTLLAHSTLVSVVTFNRYFPCFRTSLNTVLPLSHFIFSKILLRPDAMLMFNACFPRRNSPPFCLRRSRYAIPDTHSECDILSDLPAVNFIVPANYLCILGVLMCEVFPHRLFQWCFDAPYE